MSAATVIPSLLPMFMVAAIRRAEDGICRRLADANALTPETAVPLALTGSLERGRLQSLIRGGAVCLTPGGHHFLDADGWAVYRQNRRRRALIAVGGVVALLVVGVAVYWLVR